MATVVTSAMPSPDRSRERARIRWALLALALVVRLAFRLESTALPFTEGPIFDSPVYLRQAAALRAGHFGDPTLLAFGPLYGWFLAAFGGLAIDAQLVLGLATALVLERAATRAASEDAGLVTLALWIGFAVPLFYETLVMSETLGLFLAAAAFALYLDPRFTDGDARAGAAAGAALGLATLARANLIFALPFFVFGGLAPRGGEARPARSRRTTALALGLGAVLCLNGAWNYAHVGRFVPVILASRTASRASEHGRWTGSLAPLGASDAPPSAWDVVHQAEQTLASDGPAPTPAIDVGGWLASSPAKLARTFSDVETTFDYGFYGARTELRSLAWQPISMGTLLVLGLLGAILGVRRRGLRWVLPYLPLVVGTVLVTTLFHPSGRYRLSMALPLVILAGDGLVALARMEPPRVRVAGGVLTGLVVAFLGYRHLTHPLASPGMWQLRVAESEAARGDVSAARERIERALEIGGDDVIERIRVLREARALPAPPP